MAERSAVLIGFFLPLTALGLNLSLMLTAILALFSENLKTTKKIFLKNPLFLGVFAALVFILVSCPFSEAVFLDVLQALHKYAKLAYVFFLLPLFLNSGTRIHALQVFLVAMMLTVFFMLSNALGVTALGRDLGSVFKNRIDAGFLLSIAAYVSLYFCKKNEDYVEKKYLILFFVFSFAVLFLNKGKTGYLIWMVLCVHYFGQRWKSAGVFVSMVLALGAFLVLIQIPSGFSERMPQTIQTMTQLPKIFNNIEELKKILTPTKKSAYEKLDKIRDRYPDVSLMLRLQYFYNTVMLIHQRMGLGWGIGSFSSVYFKHYGPYEIDKSQVHLLKDPHNEYLMIAFQWGGVGLLGWILFLAYLIRSAQRLPAFEKALASGFLWAYAVGCFCDSFLYLSCTGYSFVYFNSILFSAYETTHHRA